MIAGIFHKGSGIGNQLHRYLATRVLALRKGYDFSMVAPDLCKVKDFMDLDMGIKIDVPYSTEMPSGKVTPGFGSDPLSTWEEKTNYYNPEFNFIEDNTIIDGEFQDERYWSACRNELDEWFKVEPAYVPDDVCVIGFRGGEFYMFPELGLPIEYFEKAIEEMKKINQNMKFEVHTDDPELAKKFFPDYKIIHNAGVNWRTVRYARYSIISNSSFYILPRWLKHNTGGDAYTIAPRFWARHNTGEWSMPQNYYPLFHYIHA